LFVPPENSARAGRTGPSAAPPAMASVAQDAASAGSLPRPSRCNALSVETLSESLSMAGRAQNSSCGKSSSARPPKAPINGAGVAAFLLGSLAVLRCNNSASFHSDSHSCRLGLLFAVIGLGFGGPGKGQKLLSRCDPVVLLTHAGNEERWPNEELKG